MVLSKLLQDKKNNPPPPRDPKLPAKPKGQTVGSFRDGLQSLPKAIADRLGEQDQVQNRIFQSIPSV